MIATPHLTPVHALSPLLEELELNDILATLAQRTREANERGLPYEEYLRRVLTDAAMARRRNAPGPTLHAVSRVRVGEAARWFEIGHRRTDLSRRGPIRRILDALVGLHPTAETMDVHRTVAVGWPGEAVSTEQGATRVYTAIRTLRRLGLEGVLLTRDSGYLLDPRAELLRVDG